MPTFLWQMYLFRNVVVVVGVQLLVKQNILIVRILSKFSRDFYSSYVYTFLVLLVFVFCHCYLYYFVYLCILCLSIEP